MEEEYDRLYHFSQKSFWREESKRIMELEKIMEDLDYSDKPKSFIRMKKKMIQKQIDILKEDIKNKIMLSIEGSTHLYDKLFI